MKLIELLRLVFINLLSNKSKGMLTSLGIVVGSATIVLVIAIGQGGKLDVADQFKNLNAGAIEVTVGQSCRYHDGRNDGGGGGMPEEVCQAVEKCRKCRPEEAQEAVCQYGRRRYAKYGRRRFVRWGGRRNKSGPSMSGTGRTTLTTDDVDDIASLVPNVEAVSITVNSTAAVSWR
jgi:putative ABC transport system permease protein